jgi:cytoskeletal protein RodZ
MKRVWLLLIGVLLLMAACAPAQPESAETVADTPVAAVETEATVPTDDFASAETEIESEPTAATDETPAETDAVAGFPAQSFDEAATFRTFDHFKGAEEPIVEIIEYGDFQ